MGWQKHSIRQLSSYSRNSFHQESETGMRSSVNVFGLTELRFIPRQVMRLFSGIRVRSSHIVRNPDIVTMGRISNQDDKGRQ